MRRFGCHKDRHREPGERELCVGWLIYQRDKRPRIESLGLRIALLNDDVVRQFEEATSEVDLYDSIDELVIANLEAHMSRSGE